MLKKLDYTKIWILGVLLFSISVIIGTYSGQYSKIVYLVGIWIFIINSLFCFAIKIYQTKNNSK